MTGRTVEEATDAALDELGVEESEIEVEILEEPKPGLFGRTRGEARIRARIRPTTPRPKVERRDRRRRSGSDGGKRRNGDGAAEAKPAARRDDPAPAVDDPPEPDGGELDAEVTSTVAEPASVPATDAPQRAGQTTASRGRRRRPTKGSEGNATSPADGRAPTEGEAMTAVSVDEQASVVRDFLEGLLDVFDLDGDLSVVTVDEDTREVQIEGANLGLLIGPKGQTLAALQDLSRSVAQRKLPGPHDGWVRVDVSGYRQRRREALERHAQQIAESVASSGSAIVLEPMSAADRKIVHDVINEIDGVTTTSEGEEPRRRVVVQPAG